MQKGAKGSQAVTMRLLQTPSPNRKPRAGNRAEKSQRWTLKKGHCLKPVWQYVSAL